MFHPFGSPLESSERFKHLRVARRSNLVIPDLHRPFNFPLHLLPGTRLLIDWARESVFFFKHNTYNIYIYICIYRCFTGHCRFYKPASFAWSTPGLVTGGITDRLVWSPIGTWPPCPFRLWSGSLGLGSWGRTGTSLTPNGMQYTKVFRERANTSTHLGPAHQIRARSILSLVSWCHAKWSLSLSSASWNQQADSNLMILGIYCTCMAC